MRNKSLPEMRMPLFSLKLTLPVLNQRPEGLKRKQSEEAGRPFPTTVVSLAR